MGDQFRLGVDLDLGRIIQDGLGGRGHHHDRGPDPLQREAWSIAQDLDRGNIPRAMQRLNDDLQQLDFESQKYLVRNIDQADRKGVGGDILLGRPDRRNGLWDDIRIIDNRPPEPYYGRGQGYPPGRFPPGGYPPGGYPPGGYPPGGYPRGGGRPEFHISIDIFKHGRR